MWGLCWVKESKNYSVLMCWSVDVGFLDVAFKIEKVKIDSLCSSFILCALLENYNIC